MKTGKFEIYKDSKKEFRFRLLSGNNKIIAISEGYKTKAGCKKGVTSVMRNVCGMMGLDYEPDGLDQKFHEELMESFK